MSCLRKQHKERAELSHFTGHITTVPTSGTGDGMVVVEEETIELWNREGLPGGGGGGVIVPLFP